MVAGYAAKEAVEGGLKPGQLAIVSADEALPYERPPLSKSFLAGKDNEQSVLISDENFYRGHGIDIHLKSQIQSIDLAGKRLLAKSGEEFAFEKLFSPRARACAGWTCRGQIAGTCCISAR